MLGVENLICGFLGFFEVLNGANSGYAASYPKNEYKLANSKTFRLHSVSKVTRPILYT